MYGYVTPVKEQLICSEFALYRAFYCGICKATGKLYGTLPRFTTNYDIVFLSVLIETLDGTELTFESKGCVCNPFKKKVTVCRNELLDKIVQTNIILSYYKLTDGVNDKEGVSKRLFRRVLKPHFLKAKAACPEVAAAAEKSYADLRELEKAEIAGIDRAADCFAKLLERLAVILLGAKADENIAKLCYNVGKFVYLADALDDVDEDYKKKRYNPFLAAYEGFTTRQEYFAKHSAEFEFILSITVNRAIECFNKINFGSDAGLMRNIVHIGLRNKTEQIFKSTKKLPKARI